MEDEKYYGDGVVTGHGLIHGRQVSLSSVETKVGCMNEIQPSLA